MIKSSYRVHLEDYLHRDEKLSDLEQKELDGKLALESVEILTALFSLLALADFSKTDEGKMVAVLDSNTLTDQFSAIGEFGFHLANNCWANLRECLDGYRQLMEERKEG